jgi:hypothetical protein
MQGDFVYEGNQPVSHYLISTISTRFMDMFPMVATNHSLAVEHLKQQAVQRSHGKNFLHTDFGQRFANRFQLP